MIVELDEIDIRKIRVRQEFVDHHIAQRIRSDGIHPAR